jgi:glycosyltransferase involved in cell wall biosynthesis
MRLAFVHNNFPGQFAHLAPALAARGHQVVAIGARTAPGIAGIPFASYEPAASPQPSTLAQVQSFETHVRRGLGVAGTAKALAERGFVPDLVFGHMGWGETLFVKDIWPDARLALYAEFFYAPRGLDVGFDPALEPPDLLRDLRVRARTGAPSMAMAQADYALAPTQFQRSTFPPAFRDRIIVQHDGVDCSMIRPRADAVFAPAGSPLRLTGADEVVTYVNRHLEPMRGLHVFLRMAPKLLALRPEAQIVVIGAPGKPYGPEASEKKTWLEQVLDEVGPALDRRRVHFVGKLARGDFLDALAISKTHVALTYPFVLSWSVIEAMAAGCAIVGSDTAPIREVIEDGRNGRLVDFFDTQAMAATIAEVLAGGERVARMRERARADALARFDLASVCLPALIRLTEAWARGEEGAKRRG